MKYVVGGASGPKSRGGLEMTVGAEPGAALPRSLRERFVRERRLRPPRRRQWLSISRRRMMSVSYVALRKADIWYYELLIDIADSRREQGSN